MLYTTALRRLAGVTQVVAPDEGHVVHNRLTHVMEVAQIGRRLAERLLRDQKRECDAVGGVDPDVVETAALAHDLGHPPFGHIAEDELDALVVKHDVADGFEGNAQSFRVVTKLSVRKTRYPGLDLSLASLAAIIKYPWARAAGGYRHKKFGAYETEDAEFRAARVLEKDQCRQTVEASIMDLADDIAYSLSDLEDFIRTGKIPLSKLIHDETERAQFVESAYPRLTDKYKVAKNEVSTVVGKLIGLIKTFPIEHAYAETVRERANLRNVTGALMDDYIRKVAIDTNPSGSDPYIKLPDNIRLEIAILKHLTFHYVICDPALAIMQQGQRTIIRGLFSSFYDAAISTRESAREFFPKRLSERIAACKDGSDEAWRRAKVRCIADFIAGMSDREAVDLYQRLMGFSSRSPIKALVY